MEEPLIVTIHCLAYNHEPFIRQCLEGFVMQKTNFRFEAIVHDDASTDGTAAIIREYAEKYPDIIKPIYETENQYSKRDGSLRRIMNAHTHGKYIAICEGDDYWTDPYKLQKQIDILEANPKCGLVHTEYDNYNVAENKYFRRHWESTGRRKQSGDIVKNIFLGDLLEEMSGIFTCTVCFRKELIDNDEIYKLVSNLKLPFGDIPLYLSILLKSEAAYIDSVTAVRRILPFSATQGRSFEYYYEFNYKSAIRLFEFFKQYINVTQEEERHYYLRLYNNLLNLCYRYKKHEIFFETYKKIPSHELTIKLRIYKLAMKNNFLYNIVVFLKYIKNKL